MRRSANPKNFLEVLKNADHRFVREATLRREHVDMVLGIQPADAVTGRKPNAAFGGNVDRLRFLARQAVGDRPEAEIIRAGRIDSQQAAFGC